MYRGTAMVSLPPQSGLGRRTLGVVLAAGLLAAPALLLRAFCVGDSCRTQAAPQVRAPFCSLDEELRGLLTDGYRQGRSPDVLAVTLERGAVQGATGLGAVPWPSTEDAAAGRVPLVFQGAGVGAGAGIPAGATLADVAPTIAAILDVEIPHPEVRSGTPIEGVPGGEAARLAVVVVWKGVGSDDLEGNPNAWPVLRRLLRDGAGTLDARVGSLPLDPTAILTTIGTGGLPREHGIIGATVRNDEGRAAKAWTEDAPFSVIAALGDDLDEVLRQRPRVGLIGTSHLDRGAIGRDWHLRTDRDDVVQARRAATQAEAAAQLFDEGYGADEVPDLLAVVMQDRVSAMDRALARIVELAPPSAAIIVTATGSTGGGGAVDAARIESDVERASAPGLVETTAVGGVFLDQDVLVRSGAGQEEAIRSLRRMRGADGSPLFADAFGGRAVEFGEYC